MFGIGMTELIIILVIILVVFGAGKLPDIGKSLGKGIQNFKKSFNEDDEIDSSSGKKKIENKEKDE